MELGQVVSGACFPPTMNRIETRTFSPAPDIPPNPPTSVFILKSSKLKNHPMDIIFVINKEELFCKGTDHDGVSWLP